MQACGILWAGFGIMCAADIVQGEGLLILDGVSQIRVEDELG
jgi:hypothetical protein